MGRNNKDSIKQPNQIAMQKEHYKGERKVRAQNAENKGYAATYHRQKLHGSIA